MCTCKSVQSPRAEESKLEQTILRLLAEDELGTNISVTLSGVTRKGGGLDLIDLGVNLPDESDPDHPLRNDMLDVERDFFNQIGVVFRNTLEEMS